MIGTDWTTIVSRQRVVEEENKYSILLKDAPLGAVLAVQKRGKDSDTTSTCPGSGERFAV